jgi:hypothetical protein
VRLVRASRRRGFASKSDEELEKPVMFSVWRLSTVRDYMERVGSGSLPRRTASLQTSNPLPRAAPSPGVKRAVASAWSMSPARASAVAGRAADMALHRVGSTRGNEPALQRLALSLRDAAHSGKLNGHAPTAVLRQTAEYSSQLLLDLVLSTPENLDWVGPSGYSILGSLKLARNVHAHDWFAQNRGKWCFQHRPDSVEWTF